LSITSVLPISIHKKVNQKNGNNILTQLSKIIASAALSADEASGPFGGRNIAKAVQTHKIRVPTTVHVGYLVHNEMVECTVKRPD